ncbi:glycosyltransferase [Candidatus Pacearchaeota archaeon]|jgi:glycosyltransferase involved in cell wall biosynthesis|nr:glycosyltransferase [Candidatus Pacearchaeota archaeon]
MKSKVSVFMATWNKNNQLPNALYSLARQKTNFDFDVCIIDDHSNVNPEPIIRKFFPHARYKRLPKNEGVTLSHGHCFDVMDKNTDIVVLQSSDVIYTEDHILQRIVDNTDSKQITMTEVIDIPIDDNMYLNFDSNIEKYINNWDNYKVYVDVVLTNGLLCKNSSTFYTGAPYHSWLFFCGGILADDLRSIRIEHNACDATLHQLMKEKNFKAILLNDCKVIHQRHPKTMYECKIIDTCPYHCIRKDEFWLKHLEKIDPNKPKKSFWRTVPIIEVKKPIVEEKPISKIEIPEEYLKLFSDASKKYGKKWIEDNRKIAIIVFKLLDIWKEEMEKKS